ncbi:hypothetical protein ANN_08647 [Periplaneta americana]|uniref:Mos1 transposase HTH domain-containing protein n=1 Tax=Periplaneta americana TaxID=6978 RepID=A0ABQ8T3E6_PERAM|nr:hypothetical protein ANN_08647 [Periplaneta americana]
MGLVRARWSREFAIDCLTFALRLRKTSEKTTRCLTDWDTIYVLATLVWLSIRGSDPVLILRSILRLAFAPLYAVIVQVRQMAWVIFVNTMLSSEPSYLRPGRQIPSSDEYLRSPKYPTAAAIYLLEVPPASASKRRKMESQKIEAKEATCSPGSKAKWGHQRSRCPTWALSPIAVTGRMCFLSTSAILAARNFPLKSLKTDNAIGESTARKWFSRFKEGRFDISDTPRSGRPSEFDEDRLNTLIHNDPLANVMNCDHSTIARHLLPPTETTCTRNPRKTTNKTA